MDEESLMFYSLPGYRFQTTNSVNVRVNSFSTARFRMSSYSALVKYTGRMEKPQGVSCANKLKEIPYIDKLLEIKRIGMVTVSGFIAEVDDIRHFDNPKQLQKLAGYAIVANDSDKDRKTYRTSQ